MGWIEGGFDFLAELVYSRQGWEFTVILVFYALLFVIWGFLSSPADRLILRDGSTGWGRWSYGFFGAWFMITKLSEIRTSFREVKSWLWSWKRKKKKAKESTNTPITTAIYHITRLLRHLGTRNKGMHNLHDLSTESQFLETRPFNAIESTTESLGQRMDIHRAFDSRFIAVPRFHMPHITYILSPIFRHINYHGATH